MSSLEEARKKIEERRAQQGSGGGGNNLWMRKDDLVIFHFLCTGGEDDPYFEAYAAHEWPAKGEGKFPTLKYCPVESAHDGNYDCEGCREGIKTKDRMIMWLWVYDILHTTLRQGETLPSVSYNNKPYFRREINGPKVWETSAWRESPLDDILMLGAQLGNLQASQMILSCTGENLSRRYKVYLIPNSGELAAENLASAQESLRPVVDILQDSLTEVPSVQNPTSSSAPTPITNGGGQIKPYVAGGAASYTPPGQAAKPEGPQEVGAAKPAPANPKGKKMF